MTIFRRIYS